jgi:hypothetical protein
MTPLAVYETGIERWIASLWLCSAHLFAKSLAARPVPASGTSDEPVHYLRAGVGVRHAINQLRATLPPCNRQMR